MDIEFFYNILKLTSLKEEKISGYIKEYLEIVNIATFNIFFEEFKNNNRNDLCLRLKSVILDKAEQLKSLDIADVNKSKALDQRFEQILLEISDPLLQNRISNSIDLKIEEVDNKMIEKVISELSQEDKTKIVNNLNYILNK